MAPGAKRLDDEVRFAEDGLEGGDVCDGVAMVGASSGLLLDTPQILPEETRRPGACFLRQQ